MAADSKDTIYIDIDDEITGIIDKLKGSDKKVVALVLPKRATVFQSIVNMKLLKRAADSDKKNLVLITSEAGLLPLAGAAGIHVAKTLTSKPEIPAAPGQVGDDDEPIDEDAVAPVDTNQPVGDLADAAAASQVETLVLDDEEPAPEEETPADAAKPAAAGKAAKKAKNKKFKIPDFNRFRLWLALGGLALILIVIGLIFATVALPKATIAIKTDASNLDTNTNVNLSTTATDLDADAGTVPAKLAQQQKTYNQTVPTTGQKNNGNKASGSVKFINCSAGDSVTIPAGTGVTASSNGATYVTKQDAVMPTANKQCNQFPGDTATVDVVSVNPGSDSNINSGASMTVAASDGSYSPSSIRASASGPINGGTDNIVQIVNQNDINTAKSKISANNDDLKNALSDQLKKQNLYPITATFSAGNPNVTSSTAVGQPASSVTVTEVVTATMFGASKDDLNTLVENSIKSQIDTSKQSILDTGLDNGVFNVNNSSNTGASLTLTTKAAVGPDLDVDSIKANAAGKKAGAIKSDLRSNPDVTDVDVKLSPFWVSTVPKKTSRIKVEIAKPSKTINSSTNANNQ